jgi:hypothetical protein
MKLASRKYSSGDKPVMYTSGLGELSILSIFMCPIVM